MQYSWVALAALSSLAHAAPTFTHDVAPILFDHCIQCHRPGQVAPFSLLTYEDAARRARLIAHAVAIRYMPPWKPVHGYGSFQHDRSLTPAQIAMIQRWAVAGAPQGDPRALPPAPRFTDDWQQPNPDLVVEMPRPFTVSADGPDLYQCFVIPMNAPHDRWVRAFEFRPSSPQVVHHALFFTDKSRVARSLDQKAGGNGYPCFGTPGFLPSTALGGWSPGNQVNIAPEGTATKLPAGADLVIQVHFHPTGKSETEQSRVALYFADHPPRKQIIDVALVSKAIDIPPGDRAYQVRDHFVLPVDVHAVGIIPHAHYICRDMKGWATLPNGRRRWLMWIRDWDFNWQDQYHYTDPIALPAGTRVDMFFTYDNSVANPRNPNSPPKRVVWGGGSNDEMAGLHIQVEVDRDEDLPELGRALWGKVMRMVGGRFFQLPDVKEQN